jgi:hypothetical protein
MAEKTRREELEEMKVHKVRSRALELGFPHAKSLNKSKDALIEFILRKEGEDDGGDGEGGEDDAQTEPPSEEEKAAAREAAGMGKGKKGGGKKKPAPPKPKGGKKKSAPKEGKKKPAPKGKPAPESEEASPGDTGAVVEMITELAEHLETMDQKVSDLIKRVDGLATGVSEGMDTVTSSIGAVLDDLVTIKGFTYVTAVVSEALPEDATEVDAAVETAREYFIEDEENGGN